MVAKTFIHISIDFENTDAKVLVHISMLNLYAKSTDM